MFLKQMFSGMQRHEVERCISVLREFTKWRPGPAGRGGDRRNVRTVSDADMDAVNTILRTVRTRIIASTRNGLSGSSSFSSSVRTSDTQNSHSWTAPSQQTSGTSSSDLLNLLFRHVASNRTCQLPSQLQAFSQNRKQELCASVNGGTELGPLPKMRMDAAGLTLPPLRCMR